MVCLAFECGIAGPHRVDERGDLAGILDPLRRLDTATDVDRERTYLRHRASHVVYAQATTQNDPRRELFWNKRPIENLSCAAIGIHVGVEQEAREPRRRGAVLSF